MHAQRFRRRGQGMTEYIILVGILALLLIAAVNKFAFAVDEAIQGSANAFILRQPADEYHSDNGGPGSAQIGVASETGDAVYAVSTRNPDGSYSWVKKVGSPTGMTYDPETHGSITSGRTGP